MNIIGYMWLSHRSIGIWTPGDYEIIHAIRMMIRIGVLFPLDGVVASYLVIGSPRFRPLPYEFASHAYFHT